LIQPLKPVLLRYGVEFNTNQSFIACIADVYKYIRKLDAVPTIKEMRKIIADAVTLDIYLKVHNGSLVSVFQPEKKYIDAVALEDYAETEFYKSIQLDKEEQRDFLEDTVASFENFRAFLLDDSALIDHSYLWDIVSMNNENLFPGGMNLVVLCIESNDATDNMEVLCPTNSYLKRLFDPNKEMAILLKHGEFYEPIYQYEQKESGVERTVTFKVNMMKNVKKIMEIIQNSTNKYCSPLSSMPKVYEFKRGLTVANLQVELAGKEYRIFSQVMNYRGKIIGLTIQIGGSEEEGANANAKATTKQVFIPCQPSLRLPDIPIQFIDDTAIWTDYITTRDYLKQIESKTRGAVPCKPMLKVVSDELIVGFLTETNQFVQVVPPAQNIIEDDIPTVSGSNYLIADKVVTGNKPGDQERIRTTKMITLETQFYQAFRNTVRILLNRYENLEIRNKIIKILDSHRMYKKRVPMVEAFLKRLCENHVEFSSIPEDILLAYEGKISTCMTQCKTKKYCIMKKDGACVVVIPDKNLINKMDNAVVYYGRMADELIRYKRIRALMFQPQKFIQLPNTGYSVASTEMIVLDSLLTPEYFNDMEPFKTNPYIHNTNYETAQPGLTQKYDAVVSLKEQGEEVAAPMGAAFDEMKVICVKETRGIVGNSASYWRKVLPSSAKEIVLNPGSTCSFFVVIHMIKEKYGKAVSVDNVKESLWNAYSDIIVNYRVKIEDILRKQGKRAMMDKIKRGITGLETLIRSEEYYLTNLDLWVLANKLNLPVVLFSVNPFKTMLTDINWSILGGNHADTFFFIRSPAEVVNNVAPTYHIVTPTLKFGEVRGFADMIRGAEYRRNIMSFDTFIKEYLL